MKELLDEIQLLKPEAQPNQGFMKQLEELYQEETKPINSYKCFKCRKTLFSDINVNLAHKYTPKQVYDHKRKGKVTF